MMRMTGHAVRCLCPLVMLLAIAACRAPVTGPGATPATSELGSAPAGARLELELDSPVILAEAQSVPVSGGEFTVDAPGDPLDGLTVQVPAGSYDEPVSFEVTYRPVTEATGLDDATLLSPLIEIDNAGAVAQDAVAVTIPVTVPEGQFPMAYYVDEATGALEGVPVLGFGDDSVIVATQHFSTLIITAQDFARLEQMEVDTGYLPGRDTWQFQNQGTFDAPRGICWGMSVSSLYYFLEERPISRVPLWGQIENTLGGDRKTLDYWQDDNWGLAVATAVQLNQDRARRDRSYDVLYQLEQDLEGTGTLLNVRLTQDQITFYSLVSALVTTQEPQLVNVTTADGKRGHSLIAYKLQGTTVYVADPNDYQASPPQRTLVLTDGSFGAYNASENLLDQLAGVQRGYTEISYWGQSALTHWQEVGRLWSQGDRLPYEPAYTLRVVDQDADGAVTDEYDLDLLNPLHISQEELDIYAAAPDWTSVRVSLMHYDHRDMPVVNGPLPLAMGENLVGVYVEGDSFWVDGDGQPQSGWRWLGFEWITVIREEPTGTPPATAGAMPSPVPTETPTPEPRAFDESYCECAGLGGPSATTQHSASRSNGTEYLDCNTRWLNGTRENRVSYWVKLYPAATDAVTELERAFSESKGNYPCGAATECTDPFNTTHRIVEETADRLTRMISYNNDYDGWAGFRSQLYRDRAFIGYNAVLKVPGSEEELLGLLDQAEACALAAADRYLGE